jgi:hypothetical protein
MQELYKQQILDKLRDVEIMLLEASCDGQQLAQLKCFADVEGPLNTLVQAIDYYVD